MAGIGFGTNYDVKEGNGLGPRTLVVTAAYADQDALDAAVQAMTDDFTVAGVDLTTGGAGVAVIALQGTGDAPAGTTVIAEFA